MAEEKNDNLQVQDTEATKTLDLAKIERNLKEAAESKAKMSGDNKGKSIHYVSMKAGPNRSKKRDKGLGIGSSTSVEKEHNKIRSREKVMKKKARKKANKQKRVNRRK